MSLLEMGVREGDCTKGYCKQCILDWPKTPELWKVSWVGQFYCQQHLNELGYEENKGQLKLKLLEGTA